MVEYLSGHLGYEKPLFKHSKKTMGVDYSKEIAELRRRVRLLEERYNNLQTRVHVTEQNMLSRHKQLLSEIRALTSEISELKHSFDQLKNKLLELIKEVQLCAKKEELMVLEKYIRLWEPIRFVTHNEVEDIIKEVIEKLKK